jgi:hypothetical protein
MQCTFGLIASKDHPSRIVIRRGNEFVEQCDRLRSHAAALRFYNFLIPFVLHLTGMGFRAAFVNVLIPTGIAATPHV